jgi:hypothetical protein
VELSETFWPYFNNLTSHLNSFITLENLVAALIGIYDINDAFHFRR